MATSHRDDQTNQERSVSSAIGSAIETTQQATDSVKQSKAEPVEEVLRPDEVDDELFIFPNKGNPEDEIKEKEEIMDALSKTSDLLAPFIARNLENEQKYTESGTIKQELRSIGLPKESASPALIRNTSENEPEESKSPPLSAAEKTSLTPRVTQKSTEKLLAEKSLR